MEIFLIAALTLISSMVGTMAGFGTSTIMIPILAMFLAPIEAIFLVSIIHWFGNIWQLTLFRSGFKMRLFVLFGISGLLASYGGAALSLKIEGDIFVRILGLFLAIYAISLIIKYKFKVKAGTKTALVGGTLSGFFAGMFGIGGPIRSAFLLAFDLPKAVYIATAGAIGLLVDSTRIITYLFGGVEMREELWWGLVIFIPISLLGARIAKLVVDKIPQDKFRQVLAILLFLMGLKLLIWP
jgi:uncharacterized membrane protein YfcA